MVSHGWLLSPVPSACAAPTVLVWQGLKSFQKRRKVRRRPRTCQALSAFPLLAAIRSGGYAIIAPWSAVWHIVCMHARVVRRLTTHLKRSAGSARIRRNERALARDRRWRSVNVSCRRHGSSSLASTSLCVFCHGVLIECRCVPVSGQSHRAPEFFPLCRCPCRIRSRVDLEVPDTYQPPQLHKPTLRTRSPSSETRSSRTRSPSLAHGFRLDRLAIVQPIRRRSPAHHRPSTKARGRWLTASEAQSSSHMRRPLSYVTPKPAPELHIPIVQRWHSVPRPHPSPTSQREWPASLSARSVERA